MDEGSFEAVDIGGAEGEAADVEAAGIEAAEVGLALRRRRITRPRSLVVALVVAAIGLTTAVWIADGDAEPELTVRTADDGDPSPTTAPPESLAADEPMPSSTTTTAEVTTTSSAPASSTRTAAGSGTRTTTAPPTTAAPPAEPSWVIELHDVSVTPSTVSTGQTMTVSWRLVSEIGIAQTFFWLTVPKEGQGFPAPSDECPHFTLVQPVSGTDRDGIYRVSCRVPDSTTPGTYGVHIMGRHHQHGIGQGDYFHNQAQFTVTAPPTTTSTTTSTP